MLPILYRHLGEGLVRPDRGIVDQDVDTAELGQGARRERVDLVLLGDIGKDGDRLDPKVADLARDRVDLGLVSAGVDHDVGALRRQFQRRGAADIAARPGDQRNFPVELTHDSTSLTAFKSETIFKRKDGGILPRTGRADATPIDIARDRGAIAPRTGQLPTNPRRSPTSA